MTHDEVVLIWIVASMFLFSEGWLIWVLAYTAGKENGILIGRNQVLNEIPRKIYRFYDQNLIE